MALLLLAACLCARADGAHTDLVQRVGERLPLSTQLTDESGGAVELARYFSDIPVVLVFGYYRCPTLCTTLMEGVLLGLSAAGLDRGAYRVVEVGIDPRENAGDAARKAAGYRAAFGSVPVDLLTGSEAATKSVANAAGFTYAFDTRYAQYSHPLGFLIASPEGRITRYFPGVRFDPRELRLALIDASQSRIGSLSERIFLRCAHYDPVAGRYSVAVMSIVRAVSLVLVVLFGAYLWRSRRAG